MVRGGEEPVGIGDGHDNCFVITEIFLEPVERRHEGVILREPDTDAKIHGEPAETGGEREHQSTGEQ